MKKFVIGGLVSAIALATSAPASAALVFVGSWDVYNAAAPVWFGSPPNGPLAYTGQEAAALLFGGTAASYQISTAGNQVANINNKAWYDTIGYGARLRAENYNVKYLGQFYGPTSGPWPSDSTAAASAFVRDNLAGQNRINYAFLDNGIAGVPEPASWALMIAGFGLVGAATRRRQSVRVTYA